MAVTLTVSKTVSGSNVNDALEGGGTGLDLGDVANGSYAPIVNKTANTGKQAIYLRHDAVTDPITDVKIYIDDYLSTGFTYGGFAGNLADYSALIALGAASGSSKNNADGLSGGLWIDMDWQVSDANAFDQGSRSAQVKIFGDNSTDGIDAATAFTIHEDSMLYWNGVSEVDATTPVAGQIGKSTDAVLGNRAKFWLRVYLTTAYADGGVVQWAYVIQYTYTS